MRTETYGNSFESSPNNGNDPDTMEQCLGHRVAGKKWVTIAANLAVHLAGIADAVSGLSLSVENTIDI